MGGDSEYEPKDSRNVTGAGTRKTPDGHWTGDPQKPGHGGEYEPRDSRNVTGTASTPDGRWTNRAGLPPLANGEPPEVPAEDHEDADEDEDEDEEDDEFVFFEPAPELSRMILAKRLH